MFPCYFSDANLLKTYKYPKLFHKKMRHKCLKTNIFSQNSLKIIQKLKN